MPKVRHQNIIPHDSTSSFLGLAIPQLNMFQAGSFTRIGSDSLCGYKEGSGGVCKVSCVLWIHSFQFGADRSSPF